MYLRLLGIIAVAGSLLFLTSLDSQQVSIISGDEVHQIVVVVADDNEERRIGLMETEHLADGTGMLFVYDEPMYPVMWMKDMLISLDILFINEASVITHIEKNVPPCQEQIDSNCPRYRSLDLSVMVLELPSGYVERNGIKSGDRIEADL